MAQRPEIKRENVKTLFESPYLRVADLQYAPGKHYYDATTADHILDLGGAQIIAVL